jgi:predicted RNA-binding protein YlxR (DUF448 family)
VARRAPPERTCLGCRRKGTKPEFLRIVRTADGRVALDASGRAAGRGAYVHRAAACISRAARVGAIAGALKISLAGSEAARLVAELKASLGGDE